ncbi:hypothetical protein FZ103_17080 [Streptomonospora sp. PA3]|uniref:hypothetical protein n=1 Tax=Streptomonospora sp. PA3 TaxID=2607326 RepID=UPI0012DD97BA|nr:hypothetical protein [Streptomonospora sp. PA3]MUL42860.1 hypothetical protein [Streptomonospora sp. PA3]
MNPLYRTAAIAAVVLAVLVGAAFAWAWGREEASSPPAERVTIGESPDTAPSSPGPAQSTGPRPSPSGGVVAPPSPVTGDDGDDGAGDDDADDGDDAGDDDDGADGDDDD